MNTNMGERERETIKGSIQAETRGDDETKGGEDDAECQSNYPHTARAQGVYN